MRTGWIVGMTALGLGTSLGCGSSGGTGYGGGGTGGAGESSAGACTLASATATTAVSALDFTFEPSCIKVTAGQTVTFRNDGATEHTVTSDSGAPASFDSGTLTHGQSFSQAFTTAGTYGYHCTFHISSGMVGTVIVQ